MKDNKYPWLWVVAEGVVLEATKNPAIADKALREANTKAHIRKLNGPYNTVVKARDNGFRVKLKEVARFV